MIDDLKLGFKTIRFAHGIKMSVGCVCVVIPLAIAMCVMGLWSNYQFPAGYFFAFSAMLIVQLLFSVNMSSLAATSPQKKRLQTRVPAVVNTFGMLVGYLMLVAVEVILTIIWPEKTELACGQIVWTVLFTVAIMLYSALAYKLYVLSTILFIIIVVPLISATSSGFLVFRFGNNSLGSLILTAAVGIVAILLCGFLSYLIFLAVYKFPISKHSQAATLRKSL